MATSNDIRDTPAVSRAVLLTPAPAASSITKSGSSRRVIEETIELAIAQVAGASGSELLNRFIRSGCSSARNTTQHAPKRVCRSALARIRGLLHGRRKAGLAA